MTPEVVSQERIQAVNRYLEFIAQDLVHAIDHAKIGGTALPVNSARRQLLALQKEMSAKAEIVAFLLKHMED